MRHRSSLVWMVSGMLVLHACGDDEPTEDGGLDAASADVGADDAGADDGGADSARPDAPATDVASMIDAGPVAFGSSIGAVGCSNSNQAVMGYLQVSTLDSMINTAQDGQAMREWLVPSGGPWMRYESQRPAAGYSAVWLNLCQRAADGDA